MKKIKRGSGITEREVVEVGVTDPWDAFFEAADRMEAKLGRVPDDFDWLACAAEEWAESVLQHAKGKPAPDTPEDFARRMQADIGRVRLEISKGNAARAAHVALLLGITMEACRVKGIWEPHALRGEKSVKAGRHGHEAVHGTEEEKQARWSRYQSDLIDILQKPNNHLSLTDARKKVAKEHGVSYGTVLRHTKDPR